MTAPTVRRCRSCPPGSPTILSRYNESDTCGACSRRQSEEYIAQLRAQAARGERRELALIPLPGKAAGIRASVLAGTTRIPELMAEHETTRRTVERVLHKMLAEGLVERTRVRGEGKATNCVLWTLTGKVAA